MICFPGTFWELRCRVFLSCPATTSLNNINYPPEIYRRVFSLNSSKRLTSSIVVRVTCELFPAAAAHPSRSGAGERWRRGEVVIFQRESSALPVHGEVAVIYFKNSILQLKHYLSVMGAGILSIAKLKLSITLIKSTAPKKHTQAHAHTFFFFFFFKFFFFC